jgi:hypothetical protein
VVRVLEQPVEARGRRVQAGVPGEDVLGVRVGAVLAHEGEHRRQIGDSRRARVHPRPRRTGSWHEEPSPGRWVESAPLTSRDHGDAPEEHGP